MTMLGHNKVCEIEDFSHPDLLPVLGEIRRHTLAPHPSDVAPGAAHRRDWETAMAARALRSWGALHDDAVILAVAVGAGETLLHLSRHSRQVFATERFHGAGTWKSLAAVALMVEPSLVSPEFDADRLVVQHMDERSLRFPDAFFDGVLCSGSIGRFDELQEVANAAYEMGRVLKPGGVLTLSADLQLSGPPGGVGWPGRSLLLSPEHVQRYIVDASGLEPVDDLRSEPSAATLETRRDLAHAIVNLDARVVGSGPTDQAARNFPSLVELEGGYVVTSVQLTLRKADRYPAVGNDWARPSAETIDEIARDNRAVLSRREAAAPAVQPLAPDKDRPGPLIGSWTEIEGLHRQRGELLARHEHTVATAATGMLARRHEVDDHLLEIDRARRESTTRLNRLLNEIAEEDVKVAARLPDHVPRPAGDTVTCPVRVAEGLGFDVVVGTDMGDPVAEMLKQGAVCDPTLVDLMLQLVAPGDRVLDLGAHLGTFALTAAAAGCHVLAVEASQRNAELLRASAAHNSFTDLRVIHAVASDAPGTAKFCANGPWGHVATEATDLTAEAVPAVTMDELLAEMGWSPIALVKLDVEGSEVRVIRSLRKLLEAPDAPPLLFESNGHTLDLFGVSPRQLFGALEALGYTIHVIEPGRLAQIRAADLQPQTILDCLALKQPPAALGPWRIDPYMSAAERVERIRADCRHTNVAHRRYMATVLAGAEPAILVSPGVVEVLEELTRDPDDGVRAAISWWSPPAGRVVQ